MNAAVRHVETDALGALRAELVRAAGRGIARRRRRRRAATLAVVAVGLLALAAGAAAVAGLGTGVAPVDELLQIERGDESGRPVALDASDPLPMDLGRAGRYQLVAYLDRNRNICTASAEAHGGGVRGGFGCVNSLDVVNRRLERRGGTWAGSSDGADSRVNQFLVAGEVESVRPLGPGDWTVRMTPPWTPEARGARPMRLVVVTDDADIDNPDAYVQPTLELTYEDGSTRVLDGP
jgi:hypothetical protein